MSYYKYDGTLAAETAAPMDNVYGSSAVETLTGTNGPDGLWGSDNDVLVGGGGDDTYYLQGSGITIEEAPGGGTDKIVAWANTNLASYANVENLEIGGDHTYGVGDAHDNIIVATGTNQQLYGGGGQDVLVGGSGADTFIVVKGAGNDAIYNFNPAQDTVRLTAGYTSFAQVQSHMTQVGSDVKLDLGGGDGVVFRNMTISRFQASDFQLQLDTSKLGAMTFDDEFNSLSLWKGGNGVWATTFWFQDPNGAGGTLASNNEQEWYINANYAGTSSVTPWTVAGGHLTLTAAPATSVISSQIDNYKYTSGEINSYHSFAQTYGYFEMRAELPHAAGGWPAFWLMPTDGSWPPELDVMETLTKDPNADWTTAHSDAGMSQGMAFIPDTADGYHTYGVLWTKTDLTWYVDGVEVFHTATPADMNKPMYMIANLALGGWGGSVDDGQLPAQMNIDYIRAYALADGSSSVALDTAHTGGASTPAPDPPASPPPAGQVLTASGPGSVLNGGAGADTLYASEGNDTLTGGAGADVFVFAKEPWSPDHITDFTPGTDKLDLSALFKAAGYSGTDPIADRYMYVESDGNGGSVLRFDRDGPGPNPQWPNTIIDLEHVAPGQVSVSDWIIS